jgi:crossover junction endodeoxyribonuclease RuvC
VIGIDPGTVALGWGVVELRGAALAHVASGVIRANGRRPARLAAIHAELCVICARYVPAVLSLEQTFVGDNVQSAFRLGEARGAVMVAASQARSRSPSTARRRSKSRWRAAGGRARRRCR